MALPEEDIRRILDNDVAGVLALLPDLAPADLLTARELENTGAARADVLAALGRIIDEHQTAAAPKAQRGKKATKETPKAQRGDEIPDVLKPDYNGPMTIDLAARRRAFFEATGK